MNHPEVHVSEEARPAIRGTRRQVAVPNPRCIAQRKAVSEDVHQRRILPSVPLEMDIGLEKRQR